MYILKHYNSTVSFKAHNYMSLNCQLKELMFIFWSAWSQTLPNCSVSMYIFVSLTLYLSFFNMLFYWCELCTITINFKFFFHPHRLTMSRYIMWLNSLSSYVYTYLPTNPHMTDENMGLFVRMHCPLWAYNNKAIR